MTSRASASVSSGSQRLRLDPVHVGAGGRQQPGAGVAARDGQQPGRGGRGGRHGTQQTRRCGIHRVPVLDLDHRRPRQRGAEEVDDQLVQLDPAELLVELRDLARRRHVDPERDREQRQPRLEHRGGAADRGPQPRGYELVVRVDRDAQHLAQQLAGRAVGCRGGVRLAGRVEPAEVARTAAQLLEQPALAEAGLAHDLHDAPAALAYGRERSLEGVELAAPAREREAAVGQQRLPAAAAGRRTDGERLDRPCLSLDAERGHARHREPRCRAVEHPLRRVQLAVGRGGHQPGREVDRVAHHGVSAAIRRSDVAREHGAAVHADLHGQRPAAVEDLPEREQHAPVVVVRGDRCAGGQEQLAAVRVHVRAEQADAVPRACVGGPGDELIERVRDGLRTGPLHQAVDAAEAEEGDRHQPVLRCAGAGPQMRSELRRERRLQAIARRVPGSLGRGIAGTGRRAAEQPSWAGRGPGASGGQACRRVVADDDLTCRRSLLHPHDLRRGGAGHQQLAVVAAGDEERALAAVDADRHAQLDPDTALVEPARLAQGAAHAGRRTARALRMAVAVEQQQQRIAAELQQAATGLVRDGQEGREAAADRSGETLGALATLPREPLGQLREAADVDEDERAVEAPDRGVRRLVEMPQQESRNVRSQRGLPGHRSGAPSPAT